MRLQLHQIAYPVTALGPGRRLGIWVQGCNLACVGCASVNTWDASGGYQADTAVLAPQLAGLISRENLTGITLSGGEPTLQAAALADLLTRIIGLLPDAELDVLLFTGLNQGVAQRRTPQLWELVDAAVCGPYLPEQPGTGPLRATANQTLVLRTPLGISRLAEFEQATTGAQVKPTIQVQVNNGVANFIGLLGPGDLPRLEAALRARGIEIGGRTWQTTA